MTQQRWGSIVQADGGSAKGRCSPMFMGRGRKAAAQMHGGFPFYCWMHAFLDNVFISRIYVLPIGPGRNQIKTVHLFAENASPVYRFNQSKLSNASCSSSAIRKDSPGLKRCKFTASWSSSAIRKDSPGLKRCKINASWSSYRTRKDTSSL